MHHHCQWVTAPLPVGRRCSGASHAHCQWATAPLPVDLASPLSVGHRVSASGLSITTANAVELHIVTASGPQGLCQWASHCHCPWALHHHCELPVGRSAAASWPCFNTTSSARHCSLICITAHAANAVELRIATASGRQRHCQWASHCHCECSGVSHRHCQWATAPLLMGLASPPPGGLAVPLPVGPCPAARGPYGAAWACW